MINIKHAPGVVCMTVGCFMKKNNGKVVTILKRSEMFDSDAVFWDIDRVFDMGPYGPRDYLPQSALIPIAGPSIDITERETAGDEVSA